MKYIYPALLLLLITSCQKGEEKIDHSKTDWEFYKLKGNVETITERSYEIAADGTQKGEPKREGSDHDYDLSFSEDGKLIKESKWIKNVPYEETTYSGQKNPLNTTQFMSGQPVIKTEYQWDKKGKNTNIIKRNPDNTQLSREEKIFKDTLLIQKNMYNLQDLLVEKNTYEYDEKKNLIKENIFLNFETAQYINSYEYDDKNRKTAENSHRANGELIYKTIFSYEGKYLAGQETFDGKNNISSSLNKYAYDSKGNLLREARYNSIDKVESIDEYTYDAQGNETSKINITGGVTTGKVTYTYDDKNNITSLTIIDKDGKTLESKTYTYTYDAQGNWIKKTIKFTTRPAIIVERKITYFD